MKNIIYLLYSVFILILWTCCPKKPDPSPCENAVLPTANFKIYQIIKYPDPKQTDDWINTRYVEEKVEVSSMKTGCKYTIEATEQNTEYYWKTNQFFDSNIFKGNSAISAAPTSIHTSSGYNIELKVVKSINSSCFPNSTNTFTSNVNIPVKTGKSFYNQTFTGYFTDSINSLKRVYFDQNYLGNGSKMILLDGFDFMCPKVNFDFQIVSDTICFTDAEYRPTGSICNPRPYKYEIIYLIAFLMNDSITIKYNCLDNSVPKTRTFKGVKK